MDEGMTAWPRISLVTPSFNQARYIVWTVRSVLLQRYPDLEYILMDGGSNDGTMQQLEPYRAHFAHITSAKDQGQADALRRGLALTTGEIMGWLNSDDLLAPGALFAIAAYFRDHPTVDAVYGQRVLIDAGNTVTGYWVNRRHSDWLQSRWDMIPQETCFWRRSLFERGGNVDPSFRFAMDYDLFSRYMRIGRFAVIPRFLAAFRKHDEAKTSTLMETVGAAECRLIWQKNGIRPRQYHRLVSQRFGNRVLRDGWSYALGGKHLPGALTGIGYDYDQVWGGLLNDNDIPPIGANSTCSTSVPRLGAPQS